MPATYGSVTITPSEESSSSELNAYYIIDMAHGAEAPAAAQPTPVDIEYAWEDPTAWRWLRANLKPAEYAELVTDVWGHGNAGTTKKRFDEITARQ